MKSHEYGMGCDKVAGYVNDLFQPIDAALAEIIERTRTAGMPEIQLAPMDARHLEILMHMLKPEKIVEIGVLGGYSALAMLRGCTKKTRYFGFEKSEDYAAFSRETFQKNAITDQCQIFVGPALDNLSNVESEGPFDVVFIDADKNNYPAYLDWAWQNLREGGVVIGDNTFAFGTIYDMQLENENSRKIAENLRAFNAKVADERFFRGTILPTHEGLTIGIKQTCQS